MTAIEKAIEENRLTHALLLKGRNVNALRGAANHIAARLLDRTPDTLASHPDLHILQARNRMRQISVDHTRDLIRRIQHTPNAGNRKVALVVEVDRMNHEAANAFLKTLEEPPSDTSIILTTAKPNALLDTIVSRCLSFWFQEPEFPIDDERWTAWKKNLCEWIVSLSTPATRRSEYSERIMRLYGLLEGFQNCLERLSSEKWELEKQEYPEHTPEEELVAIEVGLTRSIRMQLLAEIEESIRLVCVEGISATEGSLGADELSAHYEACVAELEYLKGLLDVNLSDNRMLEVFLLKLLRIWSGRG